MGIRLGCSKGRPQNSDAEALQRRVQDRRENCIAVVDDESVRMIEHQKFAELLSRPFGRGMRSHVRVENAPRTDLMATKTYRRRNEAVTETKKSQATMARPWLRTKVIQRWPELPRGLPRSKYLPTVRGETRIPNFSDSSFAILCSPHVGFSRAIWPISSRRFFGSAGRPGLRDFHRQNILNAVRCHPTKVSGFTNRQRVAPVEELCERDHSQTN